MTSPNLHKVPEIVERPIPQTMRHLLDWDFVWQVVEVPSTYGTTQDVEAFMSVPRPSGQRAMISIKWFEIDGKWHVGSVQCPPWPPYPDGSRRRGPNTTKAVAAWLKAHNVPKSGYG